MRFGELRPRADVLHRSTQNERELWAVLFSHDRANAGLWDIALSALRGTSCCRCEQGAKDLLSDSAHSASTASAVVRKQLGTNALQDAPANARARFLG
jgi:hypothetical protein